MLVGVLLPGLSSVMGVFLDPELVVLDMWSQGTVNTLVLDTGWVFELLGN